MIRFVHCVKRRPELSELEFRSYWNDPEFDRLLVRLVRITGARRLEKQLTLVIELNLRLMVERGTDEPFDGMFEFWWANARELEDLLDSEELRGALDEMEAYQRQFVDFAASRRFFTAWDPPAP